MLVPVGFGVGLTSIALGLLHACQQKGLKVSHFKPISQPSRNVMHNKGHNAAAIKISDNDTSIPLSYMEEKMGDGQLSVVLEEIVGNFNQFEQDQDVVIIEGLIPTTRQPYAGRINKDIAQTLSADIVLVATPDNDTVEEFEDRIEVSAETYGGIKNKRVIGCILNKLNSPDRDEVGLLPRENEIESSQDISPWLELNIFKNTLTLEIINHYEIHFQQKQSYKIY